ncbi:hypothetical protein TRFO_22918 [Tritrichomonas foetus]|uniref:Uncharacterized protein n=1 Tax=Tritrichomonas foetus TaxID=1144522 RepID=A0A1J4KAR9_9EUKA|nr:hypothetical protein TRFO_22918 [Tritrichomonas foetus]|eukprot:OHT08505.1 hypothetical protein TRFO_22918 [Tritrichomonas foetus]
MFFFSFILIRDLYSNQACMKWSSPLKQILKNGHYRQASEAFVTVYCNHSSSSLCNSKAYSEWTDLPINVLYTHGRKEFCKQISYDSPDNVDPAYHRCNWCRSATILFDKWIQRMDQISWTQEVSDYFHVSAKYFGKELCQSVAKLYADGANTHGSMCDDHGFC